MPSVPMCRIKKSVLDDYIAKEITNHPGAYKISISRIIYETHDNKVNAKVIMKVTVRKDPKYIIETRCHMLSFEKIDSILMCNGVKPFMGGEIIVVD